MPSTGLGRLIDKASPCFGGVALGGQTHSPKNTGLACCFFFELRLDGRYFISVGYFQIQASSGPFLQIAYPSFKGKIGEEQGGETNT